MKYYSVRLDEDIFEKLDKLRDYFLKEKNIMISKKSMVNHCISIAMSEYNLEECEEDGVIIDDKEHLTVI